MFNNSNMFLAKPDMKWFDFGMENFEGFEKRVLKADKQPVPTKDSALVQETRLNIQDVTNKCKLNST